MSPNRPHVRWATGGDAWLLSIGQDGIVLRSSVPAPPGSRLAGTLALGGGRSGTLRVKVHACKGSGPGDFLVQGRPLDLTREARSELEALLARGSVVD